MRCQACALRHSVDSAGGTAVTRCGGGERPPEIDMPNLVRARARPTERLVVLKLPLHQRTAGASHKPQNQEWPFAKVSSEKDSELVAHRKTSKKSTQNRLKMALGLKFFVACGELVRALRAAFASWRADLPIFSAPLQVPDLISESLRTHPNALHR